MNILQCISTMHGELLPEVRASNNPKVIINQGIESQDAIMINSTSMGLSKSRNLAIDLLPLKSIGIISDNDVILVDDVYKNIIKAYEFFPDADAITFKVFNFDGSDFKKCYPDKPRRHNLVSILRVSSIEITIRKSEINSNVKFDDGFGLGSDIDIGEENIFLSDLIKKGGKVYYYPLYIGMHCDSKHSGDNFDLVMTKKRMKVFSRIYGVLGGRLLLMVFLIKNLRRLSGSILNHIKVPFYYHA
ncbi:hypothetical protein [Aeromonas sp. 11P]|uniref:hypothetical protein n=1 Tax=Aeromonas sp. 11P TaxID=3452713 RepID=UPI003F7B0B2B